MFTSRPSEPRTVLLWGDRWHFPDREASEPFTHVSHAADLLAARFADEPKPVRLRLVFQPDSLESALVECPQGDRRVLTAALGGEFPALTQPDHAWGYEPVLPNADLFSTILHYETEPALVVLATQLARLGLAVDSAWPLATFLHALPEEWTDSGGVTVVGVRPEAAIAYHHPEESPRTAISWRGDSTLSEVGPWLAAILNENPDEPVMLVCADDETVAGLKSYIGDEEHRGLEVLHVGEALGRRVVLPRYHSAQLLPREPLVTAQRAAVAASIALLFAAGWAGFAFGRDWTAVRTEVAERQARLVMLRAEVAHLRDNAAEIASHRNLIEGGAAGPPAGDLLRVLSTLPPPEVVLSAFRLDRRRFEFSGWIAPSAPAGLLDRWRNALAGANPAWRVDFHSAAGGAFTASGEFRP